MTHIESAIYDAAPTYMYLPSVLRCVPTPPYLSGGRVTSGSVAATVVAGLGGSRDGGAGSSSMGGAGRAASLCLLLYGLPTQQV